MIPRLRRVRVLGTLLWAFPAVVFAQHGEHTDFEIGQSGDGTVPANQLLVEGDEHLLELEECIELELLSDPFSTLDGWFVAQEPGWEGLEEDEPAEGLFALLAGHQVSLKRITFELGFSMFDETENAILTSDGDTYVFPADAEGGFHDDLIFALPPGTLPGTIVTGVFQAVDPSSMHADSEQFSLCLEVHEEEGPEAVIPTVSEWGLIMLTLLGLTAGTIMFGARREAVVR